MTGMHPRGADTHALKLLDLCSIQGLTKVCTLNGRQHSPGAISPGLVTSQAYMLAGQVAGSFVPCMPCWAFKVTR